jgi:hypothetical protein
VAGEREWDKGEGSGERQKKDRVKQSLKTVSSGKKRSFEV